MCWLGRNYPNQLKIAQVIVSGHLHPDAVGLVLRARLPRCRGLHDARVPRQEVRQRPDSNLPLSAGASVLRLHQDLSESGCDGRALDHSFEGPGFKSGFVLVKGSRF